MIERQRRYAQPLKFKHHKGLDGMAEIEKTGMFEQIVAARLVRRAIHRNRRPHAPAQREQPLDMIHMIVGQ
ncbi:hypothetical protein D3C81_1856330 [compost metagenome]